MKITILAGEPGSGKTTVFRNLIAKLGEGTIKKEGLVVYTEYPEDKVFIAGKYEEGAVFAGSDATAKSCGPKYREWLLAKVNDPEYSNWRFYAEGERFSNSKFFDFFVNECPEVHLYLLTADEKTLASRNVARSGQNDTWRKGMATRMRNLRNNYPMTVVEQGFEIPYER